MTLGFIEWALLAGCGFSSLFLFFAPRYQNYFLIPARIFAPLVCAGYLMGHIGSAFVRSELSNQYLFDFISQNSNLWFFTILAANLFVASWVTEQSEFLGVPYLLQIPVILVCLFFAPFGLLLFYLVSMPYYMRYLQKTKA